MLVLKEKIFLLNDLVKIIEKIKLNNSVIVLCHGTFDVLHIGHIRYLKDASKKGDILIVTITADEFVNKGPSRPYFNESLRSEHLAALEMVDYVSINYEISAVSLLMKLKPNIYVKGKEYEKQENDVTGNIILEKNALQSFGGSIYFSNEITYSSSSLINKYFDDSSEDYKKFLISFKSKYNLDSIFHTIDQLYPIDIILIYDNYNIDSYVKILKNLIDILLPRSNKLIIIFNNLDYLIPKEYFKIEKIEFININNSISIDSLIRYKRKYFIFNVDDGYSRLSVDIFNKLNDICYYHAVILINCIKDNDFKNLIKINADLVCFYFIEFNNDLPQNSKKDFGSYIEENIIYKSNYFVNFTKNLDGVIFDTSKSITYTNPSKFFTKGESDNMLYFIYISLFFYYDIDIYLANFISIHSNELFKSKSKLDMIVLKKYITSLFK